MLVPMWLHRHDGASESRSVEKFSGAMRVLSRRRQQSTPVRTKGGRYVLVPPRAAVPAYRHVSGASAPAAPDARARRPRRLGLVVFGVRRALAALGRLLVTVAAWFGFAVGRGRTAGAAAARVTVKAARDVSARPEIRRLAIGAAPRRAPAAVSGRARLMARRRRVISLLAAATVLSLVLAVAGVVTGVVAVVCAVALVGYVVHLRTQARRSAAVARQRRRATANTAKGYAPADEAAPVPQPSGHRAVTYVDDHDLVPFEPESEPVEVADERVAATGTDPRAWAPSPWPRPTYAMKPPAPPRAAAPVVEPGVDAAEPRPSERPQSAGWREGSLFDEEDDAVFDERYDEIVGIVERRRAVGD